MIMERESYSCVYNTITEQICINNNNSKIKKKKWESKEHKIKITLQHLTNIDDDVNKTLSWIKSPGFNTKEGLDSS